jgi:hypothetical protein
VGKNAHRILLVQPDTRTLDAAAEFGFEVWSVTVAEQGTPSCAAPAGDRHRTADGTDARAVEHLLVDMVRAHHITHILYVGDAPVLRRAVERALVEVSPVQARALHRLHDPVAMRRLLNQSGVSPVNAVLVQSVDIARAWARNLPFPLVVKSVPDRRTVVLRDRSDLDTWVDRPPPMPCVVEDFLAGPHLLVDTVTHAGMHDVVGVTGAGGATPEGVDLLYPAVLPEADAAEVRTVVRALLDLAGHENGPVRTRVVLTADGPRIATATAFPGTDAVARLRHAATGRLPAREALAALAGHRTPQPAPCRFAGLARLRHVPDGPPLVRALERIKRAGHAHDVRISEIVFPERRAEIIVQADSPQAVSKRHTAMREQWETPSGPPG